MSFFLKTIPRFIAIERRSAKLVFLKSYGNVFRLKKMKLKVCRFFRFYLFVTNYFVVNFVARILQRKEIRVVNSTVWNVRKGNRLEYKLDVQWCRHRRLCGHQLREERRLWIKVLQKNCSWWHKLPTLQSWMLVNEISFEITWFDFIPYISLIALLSSFCNNNPPSTCLWSPYLCTWSKYEFTQTDGITNETFLCVSCL